MLSKDLMKKSKNMHVYLIDKDSNIVNLNHIKTQDGMFTINQATFRPERQLEMNKKYWFKVDELKEYQENEIRRWNNSKKVYEDISWITKYDDSDTENSVFIIKFRKTVFQMYGCGPEELAVFSIKSNNFSEYIHAKLIDISKNKTHEYIISPNGNNLYVGHGMCDGAFDFS